MLLTSSLSFYLFSKTSVVSCNSFNACNMHFENTNLFSKTCTRLALHLVQTVKMPYKPKNYEPTGCRCRKEFHNK